MSKDSLLMKVFTGIGAFTSVAGLALGIYTMAVPGTVPDLLKSILVVLEGDPKLADRERFGVTHFTCQSSGICEVGVGKLATSETASVRVEICGPDGSSVAARSPFGFPKAESAINTMLSYDQTLNEATVNLVINHGADTFSISTTLGAEGDYYSWNPTSPPAIVNGTITC